MKIIRIILYALAAYFATKWVVKFLKQSKPRTKKKNFPTSGKIKWDAETIDFIEIKDTTNKSYHQS